jgi:hypothetical protein
MSVQFNRLAYSSAAKDDIQGRALPLEPKALKIWMDGLPRGNPRQMAQILHDGLVLGGRVKMEGSDRFNQLESVRGSVIDSIAWLERQFIGSPLPLTDDRLTHARLALRLHVETAGSYRQACYELCYPKGTIPLLKSTMVGSALQRSTWHYQQALFLTWKLYQTYAEGVWEGLHRVYQFALSLKLEAKDIPDPILGQPARIHDLYVEAALMSVMNPYGFAQTEQDMVRTLAKSFAPRCSIQRVSALAHTAKIPLDADLPVDADLPDDEVAYLQFAALKSALEHAEVIGDGGQAMVETTRGHGQTLHISVLKKVKRALGLASARGFARINDSYPIETVVAMSGIHYFAAGMQDFESYMQNLPQIGNQGIGMASDWISLGAETHVQRPLQATVLDHSLGGYRLKWSAGQALRIRVGEVIGLNSIGNAPEQIWMVGVVRWLRYDHDGSVMAGIKLLSRRCNAVALRVNQAGKAPALMRGLELMPLDSHLPRRFLMSGRLDGPHQDIVVLYTFEPNRLGPPRSTESLKTHAVILSSNMDYSVLTVES